MYKLFASALLCTMAIQCSLQEKMARVSEDINTLRQNVKSGEDLANTAAKCGGSKCCGNSCGRCSKSSTNK